ncbi:MAG TPA: hypothetical protein VNU97_10475 [Rhizomicrobium sp.]|jgi:hypothetical protein|nr:hypothetical protein [Rhizomicrobium sp.]
MLRWAFLVAGTFIGVFALCVAARDYLDLALLGDHMVTLLVAASVGAAAFLLAPPSRAARLER